MRADATRNRAAILAAARPLLAERGAATGMDDIARRAGVAVGTLYRHFPTKADLIAAVVEDSIAQIAGDLETALVAVAAGQAPADALAANFRAIAARHSSDRALKAAARGLGAFVPGVDDPGASPATGRAHRALVELLELGRASGELAAPTSVTDLTVLLDGVPDASLGDTHRDRYVETVLRGLLTGADSARADDHEGSVSS